MRRDNRGISRIVEFVIMFTVFLVIVTSFYSLVNIWTRPPIVNYNQEEAMRVSEVLIGNPGCMDNNNSKTNWEEYPAYYKDAPNIDTNMSSLGFAKDKQSYGVLSMSKILGMGKITYSKAREMLALSPGQNFNISFQIIGNETKIYWGADYTNAKNVGMYKRIVAVYNPINNSHVPARLTICLFDGGFYDEKIVINEVMYNPPMVSEEKHEWVELYNPTSMAVNVTRWSIGNETKWQLLEEVIQTGEEWENVSRRGAIIPANGYAIISQSILNVSTNFTFGADAIWLKQVVDKNAFPAQVTPTGIGGKMLNNDGDTIILRNRYYDTVDSVTYLPGWGNDKNGDGHHANDGNESIEKINPLGLNDDANWDESQTGGKNGTLGRRNNISIVTTGLISIGPDRYRDTPAGTSYILYNITVMNNGNINDTMIISNVSELGWNVNITWLSGGTNYTKHANGTIAVNLSAINRTTNISHIYAKLMVNVTIPAGASSGTQNIAIIIAKSSEYSIVFDTASILAKVS